VSVRTEGKARLARINNAIRDEKYDEAVEEINNLFEEAWHYWPNPQQGQRFADVIQAWHQTEMAKLYLAIIRTEELVAAAPPWLSDDERHRAARKICSMFLGDANMTLTELAWALAMEEQPRKGRSSKWVDGGGDRLTEAGLLLVTFVDAGLKVMGLKSTKKGVTRVIAMLRAELPRMYGTYSEGRLRNAYYEARHAMCSDYEQGLRKMAVLRLREGTSEAICPLNRRNNGPEFSL
jgi:hypothetical protein